MFLAAKKEGHHGEERQEAALGANCVKPAMVAAPIGARGHRWLVPRRPQRRFGGENEALSGGTSARRQAELGSHSRERVQFLGHSVSTSLVISGWAAVAERIVFYTSGAFAHWHGGCG